MRLSVILREVRRIRIARRVRKDIPIRAEAVLGMAGLVFTPVLTLTDKPNWWFPTCLFVLQFISSMFLNSKDLLLIII